MGQQGQGAGFALDLATSRSTRPGSRSEPGLLRRALDGGPQVGLGHRRQQVQAALDEPGERRVRRDVAHPVGAHRDHQRRPFGVVDQGGEEAGVGRDRCRPCTASSHWSTTTTASGPAPVTALPARRRGGTRGDDDDPAAVASEGGGHARPARATTCRCRTGRRPRARRRWPAGRRQAAISASRPKNASAIADVVGDQAEVRAGGAGRRLRVGRDQDGSCRRIGLLEGDEVGPGIDAELGAPTRSRARCSVRSASPCRPAWYWASASSAQRRSRSGRLGHPRLRLAEYLACSPGPQERPRGATPRRPDAAPRGGSASIRPELPALEVDQRPSRATTPGPPRGRGRRGPARRASAAPGPAPSAARSDRRRPRRRRTLRR